MVITIPLILVLVVMVVGLVLYLAAQNPKVSRIGEIMFGFGLLVALVITARVLA